MKKLIIFMTLILSLSLAEAQDISGEWNGVLSVQGLQLRLVFHLTKNGEGWTATMDSPDQGATDIPVTRVSFENLNLVISLDNLKAEYLGTLKGDTIKGTFRQSGMSFPVDLSRGKPVIKAVVRPQEPKEPYPYYTEEVTFENQKDSITLAGTLSLPQKEGKFPAVVLITGSGAQNRNEEVFGHKPFLVLADYLTRKGIAVLRFDDRGTSKSKGNFKTATTQDFATDVESAVKYMQTRKEINKKKIGLIGHSEGGIIAPIVAGNLKKNIAFIVLMAGTSIRGDQLLLMQQEKIQRASGASDEEIQKTAGINRVLFDMVIRSKEPEILGSELKEYLTREIGAIPASEKQAGMKDEDYISQAMAQLNNPWMFNFIRYDPAPALEKVKCPVLALNGEKDLQVPADVNLEGIRKSLEKGGNKKVTVHKLPGLNNLFQECKTGLPSEYAGIEQTISPAVLEEIAGWILKQTK
jgi:fermentation-respiration switch protein FrsA (DUF1100 family)